MRQLLTFILFIAISQIVLCIDNCLNERQVMNFGDQSSSSIICLECKTDYVLTFNYQSCLHFDTDLHDQSLYNCARMDSNRLCIEAIEGIQLIDGSHIYDLQPRISFDSRCAIVNQQSTECLMPRLGYMLKIPENAIVVSTDFCALFKNNKCEKYFHMFFKSSTKNPAYLLNFFNYFAVDHISSSDPSITCKNGYELEKDISQNPIGCNKVAQDDKYCEKYKDKTGNCIQCYADHTISIVDGSCQETKLQNCISHRITTWGFECVKKSTAYIPTNCKIQSKVSQLCLGCNPGVNGLYCDQTIANQDQDCLINNADAKSILKCLKCKDGYYFDGQACKKSTKCTDPAKQNSFSPLCKGYQLQKDQYYSFTDPQYQKIQYDLIPNFVQNLIKYNTKVAFLGNYEELYDNLYFLQGHYGLDQYVNFDPKLQFEIKSSTVVEHCVEYRTNSDQCKKCEDNYNLYFDGKITTCTQNNHEITNCIVQRVEDQKTTCDLCQKGYFRRQNDGRCIDNTFQFSNCEMAEDGQCLVCSTGYYLNQNKCYSQSLYYLNKTLNQNLCKVDIDLFIATLLNQSEGYCQNLSSTFCLTMTMPNSVCTQCYPGYTLQENTCVPTPSLLDCKISKAGECTQCNNGYRLVNKKCFKITKYVTCKDYFCENNCSYFNFKDQKKQCIVNIPKDNVLIKQINISTTDYYLINKYDFQPYCKQIQMFYDNKDKPFKSSCLSCEQNYVIVNNADGTSECQFKCQNDYSIKVGQTCEHYIGCTKQSEAFYGRCKQCDVSLKMFEQDCLITCPANTTEIQLDGYFYCYRKIENCEDATPQIDTVEFKKEFDFSKSYSCSKCAANYFYNSSTKRCVKNCHNFTDNGNCSNTCSKFINQDACVDSCSAFYSIQDLPYQQNAKVCKPNCDTGFTRDDTGKQCHPSCPLQSYFTDKTAKKCTKCTVENCVECTTNAATCTVCTPPLIIKDNRCQTECFDGAIVSKPSDCKACTLPNCSKCENNKCITCNENFTVDPVTQKCRCKTIIDDKKQEKCEKCSEYCVSCDFNGDCLQCRNGFFLQGQGVDKNDQIKCVQSCKEYYYQDNQKCVPCSKNCKKCTKYRCYSCSEGYSLMKEDDILRLDQYGEFQCLYNCPDHTKLPFPSMCACSDINCLNCSTNPFQCDICNDNFKLISGQCVYSSTNTGCQVSQNPFCEQCMGTKCLRCSKNYTLQYGQCKPKCPVTDRIVNDFLECKTSPTECTYPCSQCNPQDLSICTQCSEATKILFQGACLNSCPPGFYFETSTKTCLKCSAQCKSCTSLDQCSSCISSQTTLVNNCLCDKTLFLNINQCVQQCPFGSKGSKLNICERICPDGQFSIYDSKDQVYNCEVVKNYNSTYCSQNLQNMPNNAKFRLKQMDDNSDSIILNIILYEVPEECYSFKMYGKDSFEITFTKVYPVNPNKVEFDVKILKTDLANIDKISSDSNFKYLNFKVYYKEVDQFLYKIKLSTKQQLIIVNDITYTGDVAVVDPVCDECEVPQQKVVTSATSIACPADTKCTENSISVFANSDIVITQSVSAKEYQGYQIIPHSLKILIKNASGVQEFLQITNYTFDNTAVGKIIYKFKAVGLKNGQLTVTSKILDPNNKRMLLGYSDLDVSKSKYKYTLKKYDFVIIGKDDNNNNNNNNNNNKPDTINNLPGDDDSDDGNTIIIVIVVITVVCTLLIAGLVFWFCKKRRSKNYQVPKDQKGEKQLEGVQEQQEKTVQVQEQHRQSDEKERDQRVEKIKQSNIETQKVETQKLEQKKLEQQTLESQRAEHQRQRTERFEKLKQARIERERAEQQQLQDQKVQQLKLERPSYITPSYIKSATTTHLIDDGNQLKSGVQTIEQLQQQEEEESSVQLPGEILINTSSEGSENDE